MRQPLLTTVVIGALFAAHPSFAADWTDANSNTYTALKYIKGERSSTNGGPYIITDVSPNCTDTVKLRCKLATIDGNECFFCSRATYDKNTNDRAFTCFRITSNIRVQRTSAVQAESSAVFIEAGSEYSISVDFNNGSSTTDAVKINGDGVTMDKVLGTSAYTPTKMVIFASHSAGNNVSSSSTFANRGSYYLYNLQIYSSAGALNHNFMPAKNASDVAGLYDTVTGTFYGPTGPSGYTAFTVGEWGTDRAGKRWTGLGADNKMSNGDNWQGGVAPSAGDDLDFTIAVPFAAIDADIDATFGKVYLGTGDLPAFIGSLSATAINDLTRMQAYDAATAGFTFMLEAPTGQDFTWNGADAANWWATDIWTYNSAASSWYDNNNAIFNTANATATLDAGATAASVAFNAPATIGGAATLTVPTVSVASGVSATISAPTAGGLEKTGAGTLTLAANRTDATIVTEGTLKMNGATVAGLTLGTDGGASVTFDYGGQGLVKNTKDYLVTGSTVTLTNGIFSTANSDGLSILDDTFTMPSVLTIAKDAVVRQGDTGKGVYINNTLAEVATINVIGGTLGNTGGCAEAYLQYKSLDSRLNINVAEGGLVYFPCTVYALCKGGITGTTPSLYMTFSNSGFNVGSAFEFGSSYSKDSYVPTAPTAVFAATNSTITVATTFAIGRNTQDAKTAGSFTADFENCVVTTQWFIVNHDRPLNNAHFNNTRFVFRTDGAIAARTGEDKWITVGDDGLTFDTQAFSCTLGANLGGSGAVTKVGTGTLTVASNQTASAAFNVGEGTLAVNGGVSISRPIAVANGATFTVNATSQATVNTLTLEAGSTLNIVSFPGNNASLSVAALRLPAEGTVALKLNAGDFTPGRYAILEKSGITVQDVQDKLVPNAGVWEVSGNTLYLVVKGENDILWVGGTSTELSNGANWLGGSVPSSTQNAVISAPADTVLTCSVDFSPASITFPAGCPALTIGGENDAGEITGITSITNLSSNSHVINVPVRFAGDIQVKQAAMAEVDDLTKAHVTFAGGAYAAPGYSLENGNSSAVYSRCIFGKYYLASTAGNPWTALYQGSNNRVCLAESSSLYIPYAGKMSELYIGGGAKVDVGEMAIGEAGRVSYRNNGEIVVTNLTLTGSGDRIMCWNQGTTVSPVFKFERVENSMTNNWFYFSDGNSASKGVYYIGAGGLNFKDASGYATYSIGRNASNDAQTLRPWYSDFTIADRGDNAYGLALGRNVTFCTADEKGVGRTITINAITHAFGSPTITVSGSGTLKVNNTCNNEKQPPVTVTDTATLAIKPGASLGTGATTVKSGATLAVAESGTVTLGGNLTLKAGAKLGFNYTGKDEPVLDLTGKTVTFDKGETTNVVVKISADAGKRAKGGANVLTSGGKFGDATVSLAEGAPDWVKGISVNDDGNLVLDVKPRGLFILVQ